MFSNFLRYVLANVDKADSCDIYGDKRGNGEVYEIESVPCELVVECASAKAAVEITLKGPR